MLTVCPIASCVKQVKKRGKFVVINRKIDGCILQPCVFSVILACAHGASRWGTHIYDVIKNVAKGGVMCVAEKNFPKLKVLHDWYVLLLSDIIAV